MARAVALLALFLGLGCAAPQPAVVEVAVDPETPATPDPPHGSAPPAHDDAPPPGTLAEAKEAEALKDHRLEVWMPKRAARLGMDPATAQARDDSFSVVPPEDGLWWDEQLAEEVHTVWNGLCRECHQGNRSKEKVLAMPSPEAGWSATKTRFFKWERVPKDAFRIVVEGQRSSVAGSESKDMPAWSKKLSNEQMWGLVYFISSASKKKGHDLK
jgi:hypothetical protein